MILERLVLHNFGVYGGRHVVELDPPSPQKPVILIGGLNGGGKTTLLDALQLALYGRLAACSNRGDLAYDEYLRRTIHRGGDPRDGAGVEVEMAHVTRGKRERIHVRRWWTAREKGVREQLEVCVDGALDRLLTDAWAERVEELIPSRLSRFFFFDGEKIEALADPDRSADALRTAIHVLLGIDLVDQLVADLQVIERRKRAEHRSDAERREVEAAEAEVARLRARREELVQQQGAATNAAERARKLFAEAEERFRAGGGEALSRRQRLESDLEAARRDLEHAEEALREEAAGIAPLLLVSELLAQVAADAEAAEARADAKALGNLLAARDARALIAADTAGANLKVLKALEELFEADRRARAAAAEKPGAPPPSPEVRALLAGVRASLSEETPARLLRALERADAIAERLAALERLREATPEEDQVAELAARRSEKMAELAQADDALRAVVAELERVSRELQHHADRLERLTEKDRKARQEEEAVARVVTYAERVRATMKRFRQAILDRRIARISALVLEGFRQLLRKESLITGLTIDPRSFAMTLHGADGRALSPERLSAGERQLLAVSIIGALAKASGRALPVVIDTPLGRLDSVHRDRLVERYFPSAGHQVVLLSTDKEIDQGHLDKIAPYVGRSYVLQHDDRTGSSSVEPGYFF